MVVVEGNAMIKTPPPKVRAGPRTSSSFNLEETDKTISSIKKLLGKCDLWSWQICCGV